MSTLTNVKDQTLKQLENELNEGLSNASQLFQSSKFAKQINIHKPRETVDTLEETCFQLGKLLAYKEVLQRLGQLKSYDRTNITRRR